MFTCVWLWQVIFDHQQQTREDSSLNYWCTAAVLRQKICICLQKEATKIILKKAGTFDTWKLSSVCVCVCVWLMRDRSEKESLMKTAKRRQMAQLERNVLTVSIYRAAPSPGWCTNLQHKPIKRELQRKKVLIIRVQDGKFWTVSECVILGLS